MSAPYRTIDDPSFGARWRSSLDLDQEPVADPPAAPPTRERFLAAVALLEREARKSSDRVLREAFEDEGERLLAHHAEKVRRRARRALTIMWLLAVVAVAATLGLVR